MSFRTCRVIVVGLATAVVFASGCSGKKSGSVAPSVGLPQQGQVSATVAAALSATRSQAARIAAANTPRPGSVSQSSNADSASTTTDRVEVTLTATDQQINYRATQTEGQSWSIGNSGAAEVLRDGDFTGIGLVQRETGGQRMLVIYTDADPQALAAGNTDWMAAGVWAFIPDSQNIDDSEFGAFADGGDPFEQDNLQALTGNASYQGEAYGVYYYRTTDGEDSSLFNADVTLTADFGDAAGLGTVSGLISNVTETDGEAIPGNPQVILGPASIGAANSGFFTGDTSMVFNDRPYAGKWGGQFLGNGAAAIPDSPSKVAGTFGAAASEQDAVGGLVGAFGASRPAASGSN